MFGSYAYGIPSPEGDVDILVIMDTPLRETKQAVKIRQHISNLFGIDILIYTPNHLNQRLDFGDTFLQEITEKGRKVYESYDG